MGCDIHGLIEVQDAHDFWNYTTRLSPFVGRSYDSFGLLFGVRNGAGFEPLFADRGLPPEDELSIYGKDRMEERFDDVSNPQTSIGAHSPSYCTLDELQQVDWSVACEALDSRYTVLDENKELTGTKFGWASLLEDLSEQQHTALDNGEPIPHPNTDGYIQRRKMTREEALSGAWDWLINEYMPTLAERFGEPEDIRLTVWFDN